MGDRIYAVLERPQSPSEAALDLRLRLLEKATAHQNAHYVSLRREAGLEEL